MDTRKCGDQVHNYILRCDSVLTIIDDTVNKVNSGGESKTRTITKACGMLRVSSNYHAGN